MARPVFIDHIPPLPPIFLVLRLLQVSISITLLALAASSFHYLPTFTTLGRSTICLSVQTCLVILFYDFAAGIYVRWYNRIAVFIFECILVIWWMVTWICLMIWIDSADFDSFLLHDRGERLRKRFVGATILSAVEFVLFFITISIYTYYMYRMHTLGAPYTYLAPWREELSNPIHRPILGTVVELRLQALRDGNMSPRKTSNPDSGIGMGEAEGAREQRVTGAGLGIGGWQVEVPEIVIVPASPQRVRLSKGKERIREGCLEVPRVERRNTME